MTLLVLFMIGICILSLFTYQTPKRLDPRRPRPNSLGLLRRDESVGEADNLHFGRYYDADYIFRRPVHTGKQSISDSLLLIGWCYGKQCVMQWGADGNLLISGIGHRETQHFCAVRLHRIVLEGVFYALNSALFVQVCLAFFARQQKLRPAELRCDATGRQSLARDARNPHPETPEEPAMRFEQGLRLLNRHPFFGRNRVRSFAVQNA